MADHAGRRMLVKIFNNCAEATQACLSSNYFSIAHLYKDEPPKGIHTHNCYELYYSVSGAKQFFIDNQFYPVEPGNAFFINQFESHCLTQIDKDSHERILILISPSYLKSISTDATDLDACFREHPSGQSHRVALDSEAQKRFLFYIDNLKEISNFGSDIMERSTFALLMVYMTKRYLKFVRHRSVPQFSLPASDAASHNVKVAGILSYINQNLNRPISLEQIAGQFHLSPSYICRIFKDATGDTVNKYITTQRILQAKVLLTEGHSVTEAAERCGFENYSTFFRAFTKVTGISPKNYVQFSTHRELTGGQST